MERNGLILTPEIGHSDPSCVAKTDHQAMSQHILAHHHHLTRDIIRSLGGLMMILILGIGLVGCPSRTSIMTDEELDKAAQQGDQQALDEIAERARLNALPRLPDDQESEKAYLETLAKGDMAMIDTLANIGNPWARFAVGQRLVEHGPTDQDRKVGHDFVQAAVDRDVVAALRWQALAYRQGLYGYTVDAAKAQALEQRANDIENW